MSASHKPRSQSTQERDDPPAYIFERVPAGAKPITADDIDAMCGPDVVGPEEIDGLRWPLIRARILLRELYSKFKDRGGPAPLYIIADLAFTASDEAHEYWISFWCLRFDPDLTHDRLAYLIENASPRYWDGDQIAGAFEVTFKDKTELELEQTGCSDDYDGAKRRKHHKEKNAANNRAWRARNSSGRPPGRPPLDMTPEEKKAHRRQQQNESKRRRRGDKNPVIDTNILKENPIREKSRNKCRHRPDDLDAGTVVHLTGAGISMSFGKLDADLSKAASTRGAPA